MERVRCGVCDKEFTAEVWTAGWVDEVDDEDSGCVCGECWKKLLRECGVRDGAQNLPTC
jgi:hypothetical protein